MKKNLTLFFFSIFLILILSGCSDNSSKKKMQAASKQKSFQLVGKDGEPIAGVDYVLKTDSGRMLEGRTGKDGKTKTMEDPNGEEVSLYVYPQTEIAI